MVEHTSLLGCWNSEIPVPCVEGVLSTSEVGIVVDVIYCTSHEQTTLLFRWANCTLRLEEVTDTVS